MSVPEVHFVLIHPAAKLPFYATEQSAGLDISAALDESIHLNPSEWIVVPTGLKMEIPKGYECQVRPRSGLAAKKGVTVLNSPGTIDSDYRGEIRVVLINHGKEPFEICSGDRIAQLVFAKVSQIVPMQVQSLSDTSRGEGGFGSTGYNNK